MGVWGVPVRGLAGSHGPVVRARRSLGPETTRHLDVRDHRQVLATLRARASVDAGPPSQPSRNVLTYEDVSSRARADHQLALTLTTIGPYFRLTCYQDDVNDSGDVNGVNGVDHVKSDAKVLLGESEGVVVPPLGVLHVDSMRIYNSKLKRLTKRREQIEQRGQIAQWEQRNVKSIGMMGLGRLLAKALAAYGLENGCRKAEILAINDDDETHRKLVLYYRRLGFKVVKEVTGGLGDLPDMLVWGGVGTRMDANLEAFLRILAKDVEEP